MRDRSHNQRHPIPHLVLSSGRRGEIIITDERRTFGATQHPTTVVVRLIEADNVDHEHDHLFRAFVEDDNG